MRRWLDACPPWLRPWVLWAYVKLTGRPVDIHLLRAIAVELEEQGRTRALRRCWALISAMDAPGPAGLDYRLTLAAHAGRVAEARWLLARVREAVGVPPGRMLWLAGVLAAAGHPREAGRVLAEIQGGVGGVRRLLQQSPSIVSAHLPGDLDALLASLRAGGSDAALLQLARMCFTLRRLDAACRLYRRVQGEVALLPEDSVAMSYAACRNEHPALAGGMGMPSDEVRARLEGASGDSPDALAMLAFAALWRRQVGAAWPLLERAVRTKYAACPELPALLDECRAMMAAIAELRDLPEALPVELCQPAVLEDAGVRKVFICGFGWSGSGAVYDDVRDAVGFAEFEGAGSRSAILNEDSDTEATFIQATAGLGEWWVSARHHGDIPWHRAWDMLCLHVLGLAGIGYDNHKSCAAAENNLRRFGPRYVRPFRRLLEAFVALRRAPTPGGLHAALAEAGESLCRMLVDATGASEVLFNNAVFGREVEMLEIFGNCRAVVVFRDPADVYADRVAKDRNHWRNPAQLAELYCRGLARYLGYRERQGARIRDRIREVPFERFVLDAPFRNRVRGWLLQAVAERGCGRYFDPSASARNIGLHEGVLDRSGRRQIRPARRLYERLDALADSAWRDTLDVL